MLNSRACDEGDDMSRREHWDRVFTEKAVNSVTWYQARPDLSLALIERAKVAPDAAIIDIGGGASTLVDHLLDAGYRDIEVLDIAASALAHSRERLATKAETVQWTVADITTWQPSLRYDLWHDRAVFHFLTEARDRRAYCAVLDQALKPGGFAVISSFAPDGPEKCSGLPVERYDANKLMAELGPGYRLLGSEAERHLSPAGREQSFAYFLLRRN